MTMTEMDLPKIVSANVAKQIVGLIDAMQGSNDHAIADAYERLCSSIEGSVKWVLDRARSPSCSAETESVPSGVGVGDHDFSTREAALAARVAELEAAASATLQSIPNWPAIEALRLVLGKQS